MIKEDIWWTPKTSEQVSMEYRGLNKNLLRNPATGYALIDIRSAP